MSLQSLAANGKPIEDYGLNLIDIQGHLSMVPVQYGTAPLLNLMGSKLSAQGVSYGPRPWVVSVAVRQPTTLVAARTALGAWYLATQGMVEWETIDAPGKISYGVMTSSVGDVDGAIASLKLSNPALVSVGVVTGPDPFWYDRSPTAIGGGTNQRVVVPCGTAPSVLRLWVAGAYTTPILTVRDRAGNVLAQMRFTDTTASSAFYLDLNMGLKQYDRYNAGARAALDNAWQYLNAADDGFVIDPLDGATIEVNSSSFEGLCWRAYQV